MRDNRRDLEFLLDSSDPTQIDRSIRWLKRAWESIKPNLKDELLGASTRGQKKRMEKVKGRMKFIQRQKRKMDWENSLLRKGVKRT
jgi:hypothetical protein